MRLPDSVREPLDAVLDQLGFGRIRVVEPVGGGCISETGRLRLADDRDFFLKWTTSDAQQAGLFRAEADSLNTIAATRAARVPQVIDVHDPDPAGVGASAGRWLLLEWLEPGAASAHTWSSLGQALAALHRNVGARPGWPSDNFIGTLPQANSPTPDWPSFWRERRLLPQLERASASGLIEGGERARFDALFAHFDELLAPATEDGASLLHGDLWSGNLHVLDTGEPALVDPASFWGHREVDLSMSYLFGGFDPRFYASYTEAWPLQPGFQPARRAAYQLYYLLVHVNLFGAGYRDRTLDALRSIGF